MLWELDLTLDQVEGRTFYYGTGCGACNNTGYRGRTGIFELMVISDHLRELIMKRVSTGVIREAAIAEGMQPLRNSGLAAIYDGIATIEEIVRETLVEQE